MTEAEYRTGRFHDGEGWRAALVREGRTKLHVTHISESGVIHRAYPRDQIRHVVSLPYKGGIYPLARMVKQLRAIGRERGVTEAAKEELSRASA